MLNVTLKTTWRAGAAAAGAAAVVFGIWLWWAPGFNRLVSQPPARSRLMDLRQQEAKRRHRPLRIHYQWVPLSRIAPALRQAVLVAEDDMFYLHDGLDWEEIRAVWKETLQRGRFRRGASTITQQTAKNLFLSPKKSPFRKLKEAMLAKRMEKRLGKRRILELYLNIAEWGHGVFGAEAAARHYFQKSAADLSWEEAVALAAVLPSPLRHSPLAPDRFTEFRKTWINHRLLEKGILPPSPIVAVTALLPLTSTAQAGTEIPEAGGDTQAGTGAPLLP
ncbi:MAG: monofunctional biosynthetic peptidoglycan transglycosylase [candidate division FCPU426 bacterium]